MTSFPLHYRDSRQKFGDLFRQMRNGFDRQSRCELKSLSLPSYIPDLSTEAILIHPKKEKSRLFVVTTGVHGSESYAGAALLFHFMKKNALKWDSDNTGFLFLHCMNPYGFFLHERCTEAGVNLNRNFSVEKGFFETQNPESKIFSELFLERTPVQSLQSRWLQSRSETAEGLRFGDFSLDRIIRMTAPGQFYGPEHLEYGGRDLEPQSDWFVSLLSEVLPEYESILAFDVHTGLGDRDQLHILGNDPGEPVDPVLFEHLIRKGSESRAFVHTPSSAEGFYPTYGALQNLYYEMTHRKQRVCSLTLEYGTLGHSTEDQIEGMNLFILAHQGRLYGYADENLRKQIVDANFARSYPNRDDWRNAVLTKGEFFLTQALNTPLDL